MSNLKIIPFALLLIGYPALAQQVPVNNGQMQQIPTVPKLQALEPKLAIDKSAVTTTRSSEQLRMLVHTLNITGAVIYSEAELIRVTGFQTGTELNLDQLRQMAARISDFYRQHGYFVAQAYLPAQDVRDGHVRIDVMEGRYGRVSIRNQSQVSTALLNNYISDLHEKDVISATPLEHSLLLLSDVPGIKVNSVLAPGSKQGESDLSIQVEQGARIFGSVDVDNAGNRYTGEYRYGLTLNLNEPFGQGDLATIRALTSGVGLRYGRVAYQMQLAKWKLGVAYSELEYKLGKEFEILGAHGNTKVSSVFMGYPLLRSRDKNRYAQLGFDSKVFKDTVDAVNTLTNKKSKLVVASIVGDFKDHWGGGAQNNYGLSLSSGKINLQSPVPRAFDADTAQQNGHFSKFNFNFARLQNLSDSISLYGSLSGQVASKNLDVSEKMELGGMYAVRAYPEGEAFADQGALANVELRWRLPLQTPSSSHFQLIGFVDTGRVGINKSPWTVGSNYRSLSGAGLGLTWSDYNNFIVKAYYAKKLSKDPARSAPDRSGRFWIQAVSYF